LRDVALRVPLRREVAAFFAARLRGAAFFAAAFGAAFFLRLTAITSYVILSLIAQATRVVAYVIHNIGHQRKFLVM
jgi:hypothetical protein